MDVDPNLPVELARLQQQYLSLVAEVTAGHVGMDDARRMLDKFSVFDASGARWSVDVEGDFTRQATPRAPVEKAPPARFVEARPAGSRPPRAPAAVPDSEPSGLRQARPASPPVRPRPAGDDDAAASWTSRMSRWFGRHRTVAVAVAAVVALAVGGLVYKGSSGSTTPPASTLPSSTVAPPASSTSTSKVPGSLPPATTSSTSASSTSSVSTVDPQVPPGDVVSGAVAAFKSGDRAAAAKFVSGVPDPAALALVVSFYAGTSVTHLDVRPGNPAPASTPGEAVQLWSVVDAASGQKIRDIQVSWVFDRRTGKWLLKGLPDPDVVPRSG